MDKRKEEKQFLKNLDRLLKGEELEDAQDANEDYQTAIKFSRKLADYRTEPSAEFKEQLHRRLLLKLAAQDEEKRQKESTSSFWESVRNLFAGSAVRRAAVVATAAFVLTFAILAATGRFSPYTTPNGTLVTPTPEAAVTAPPPDSGYGSGDIRPFAPPTETALVVEAVSQQIVAMTGETIEIELVFRNTGTDAINLIPFPPAIDIRQAETKDLAWSLPEGDEEREIQPLAALNYTIVWNQLDSNGLQIKPAEYAVFMGSVTIQKGTEPEESHESFGLVAHILVQSP